MGDSKRLVVGIAAGAVLLATGGFYALGRAREATRNVKIEVPKAAAKAVPSAIAALAPVANELKNSIGDRPAKVERSNLDGKDASKRRLPGHEDGALTVVTITTGNFDIDRRYRSMEGPYAIYPVRLGADAGDKCERELWWWKGARIVVIDESGEDLGPEFMCHLNIDVDAKARSGAFTKGGPQTPRLLTLTQGEMEFRLPRGRAVPVASDEVWSIMFQVLNHNRENFKTQVRQRLELYFVRDEDLFNPVDPLAWYGAYVWVPVSDAGERGKHQDSKDCACCTPLRRGLEATNNVKHGRGVDAAERAIVGHWVVPPGKNTWTYPLKRSVPQFRPEGERLFATWTHIHPFTEEVRLLAHSQGCSKQEVVASTKVQNRTDGLIGIERIQSLYSEAGVPLPTDVEYELAVDYDNPTGKASDSMTSLGLFIEDRKWSRPAWATRIKKSDDTKESCGLGPEPGSVAPAQTGDGNDNAHAGH